MPRKQRKRGEKMFNAVIIDQSYDLCELVRSGLEDLGIHVAAVSHDGAEGYQLIRKYTPDLVVTDLILPNMDGMSLIEALREEGLRQIRIFVMSSINAGDLLHILNEQDISGFFLKPYDLTMMVRRILSVMDPLHDLPPMQDARSAVIAKKVYRKLHQLAVPPHIQGYAFLAQAVQMVVLEPELLHALTTRLYPILAAKYHSTASRVERNMRHAVELAWNRCRTDEIEKTFGNTLDPEKDKPTNRQFIAILADHIRMDSEME